MKILILTNQLLITCGVSKHLLYFLQEVKKYPEYEFTIVCGGGDAIDSYKNLCKEVIVIPTIRHEKRSFYYFLKSVFLILRLQKKNGYSILHSQNHYAANIAQVVSKLIEVKTLQSIHGIIEPIGRLNHYPADYFIVVNEHILNYLIKEKDKEFESVRLIRSGMSVPFEIKKKREKIVLIAAGRLIPLKGFEIYIRALSLLNKSTLMKAQFIIAGKGTMDIELVKLSKELGVEVNFIGEVVDLATYLSNTDIFICSSYTEGFPITIIEAALSKNLIISSDFFGYNSILSDNLNALIFPKGNQIELAKKIEYAIENYQGLNFMIDRMFQQASKEFSIQKMLNQTLSFYSEIIGL